MRRRTRYLAEAAARNDPRLAAVREFYGTLDSRTVFGRIKDSRNGPWRSSTSDNSHLWHIHISVFRAYTDKWDELRPILSVLAGESLEDWLSDEGQDQAEGGIIMLPRKGDKGEHVEVIQRMLVAVGHDTVRPGGDAKTRYDGVYGEGKLRLSMHSAPDSGWSRPIVSPWMYYQLIGAVGALGPTTEI